MIQLVAQEGGGLDLIWLLIPLVCCLMMGQRGEKPQEPSTETDTFYTPQPIQETYDRIAEETAKWRQEAREKKPEQSPIASVTRLLRGGEPPERFTDKERTPPRLLALNDATGLLYFEFTEVEGGGTVVKATYNASLKPRVARLKAAMPLKIPAPPTGPKCPSCGRQVHPEFKLCPYCGTTLITE